MDPTADPKSKNLQWHDVTNVDEMEEKLLEFCHHHFAQAEGTPFTIEPLKSLVGDTGFSEFCDQLLNGTIDLESLDIPNHTKLFLKHLHHKVAEAPSEDELTHEGVMKGFLAWPECTSTSPEGGHLGLYKSLCHHK